MKTSESDRAGLRAVAERIGPDVLLALGGGAARGVAHIGVLRVLAEAGFRVRGVAGTSIGSILGAGFCAGRLDDCEEFLRALGRRGMLKVLDPVVPRSGLFAGKRLVERCEQLIGDLDIRELATPFVAVAADVRTGQEVRLTQGRLAHSLRASSGIPGFFDPYPMSKISGEAPDGDEQWLVDGIIASPVPVPAARSLGDWPIIAVDVNVPFDERVVGMPVNDSEDVPTEEPAEDGGRGMLASLTSAFRRDRSAPRPPSIIEALYNSSMMLQHNLTLAQYLRVRPELVIEPNMTGVNMFDFNIGEDLIAEGERSARQALAAAAERLGVPGDDRVG